jgi:hypothetical protein
MPNMRDIFEMLLGIFYSILELLNIFSWLFSKRGFPGDEPEDKPPAIINNYKNELFDDKNTLNKISNENFNEKNITDFSDYKDILSDDDVSRNLWNLIDKIASSDNIEKKINFENQINNLEEFNNKMNSEQSNSIDNWVQSNVVLLDKWMFCIMLGCVCLALFGGF